MLNGLDVCATVQHGVSMYIASCFPSTIEKQFLLGYVVDEVMLRLGFCELHCIHSNFELWCSGIGLWWRPYCFDPSEDNVKFVNSSDYSATLT